jgi:hypothetical protein
MVGTEELQRKYLISWFPGVVCCGVALPPNQVLQLTVAQKTVPMFGCFGKTDLA